MYLTGLFPCHPINVNTSQGVTADLPQPLVDDSQCPLMSEGLSKVNHNSGEMEIAYLVPAFISEALGIVKSDSRDK